ncbi:MAG: glycogen/starch/alpha-glucan phosphorylase [Candidatus Acidiferrum sp.]
MSTESLPVVPKPNEADALANLTSQYGIEPLHLAGTLLGLYERHLLFDNDVDPAITNAREHYEAFARSVRDILSQRWVLTNRTYHRANPKRVYYLSMEFLIGRSLANNVTNLMLDPLLKDVIDQKNVDWLALLQKEPDAGLGNGGLGRLAACFLDSMAHYATSRDGLWPSL